MNKKPSSDTELNKIILEVIEILLQKHDLHYIGRDDYDIGYTKHSWICESSSGWVFTEKGCKYNRLNYGKIQRIFIEVAKDKWIDYCHNYLDRFYQLLKSWVIPDEDKKYLFHKTRSVIVRSPKYGLYFRATSNERKWDIVRKLECGDCIYPTCFLKDEIMECGDFNFQLTQRCPIYECVNVSKNKAKMKFYLDSDPESKMKEVMKEILLMMTVLPSDLLNIIEDYIPFIYEKEKNILTWY